MVNIIKNGTLAVGVILLLYSGYSESILVFITGMIIWLCGLGMPDGE